MKKLRITIGNKSYDVTVEDLTQADSYQTSSATNLPTPAPSVPVRAVQSATPTGPKLPVDAGAVTSPMAGTIKSVLVKPSESVRQGQPLVVLESMKMENQITAPIAGTVVRVDTTEGESVQEGQVLVVLE